LFFFSSRRRHTRSKRDWSSDVCSSDLIRLKTLGHSLLSTSACLNRYSVAEHVWSVNQAASQSTGRRQYEPLTTLLLLAVCPDSRSEERRVGKEGGLGGRRY